LRNCLGVFKLDLYIYIQKAAEENVQYETYLGVAQVTSQY